MNAANKVVLNTSILYAKMLITVGISLYTTRLVLDALGVTDYGIYNLIAAVVAMLSFLNAAMTTSTQRYLSFYQGLGDVKEQKIVFTNSIVLHVIIGFIVVILFSIIGCFLFNGFLDIPDDRLYSGKMIYYFMIITVVATVLSVPFVATLNARENMIWIVIVNIIEVILKLGIAISLFVFSGDKLIYYGLLMAIVSIVSLFLYAIFCLKKYSECSLNDRKVVSVSVVKKLSSFAGWNLFGALCGVGRTQGLAVILNVFYGAVINAAYGIANQVAGQMNFFSATMLRALNPQIMKSEGAGDRKRMLKLSMIASKFGFFLLAFIAIPCIFEMPDILQFWLKEVPQYSTEFCILILISIMTNQLTIGLQSAAQATGKIKVYQSVIGSILLFTLPVSYFLLKSGFAVYYVMIGFIVLEFTACVFRLFFLQKIAGLSIKEYMNRVIMKEFIPVFVSICVCILCVNSFSFHFRFIFTIVVSSFAFVICIYLFGLCNDEKELVNNMIKKILQNVRMSRKTE